MTNKRIIFISKSRVNKKGKPYGGKRIPKQLPKIEFTVTEIGLAKRESGKYKSRWHSSKVDHRPVMKNGFAVK